MISLAFFLLGALVGIFAWLYIDHFIPNLQQEIIFFRMNYLLYGSRLRLVSSLLSVG